MMKKIEIKEVLKSAVEIPAVTKGVFVNSPMGILFKSTVDKKSSLDLAAREDFWLKDFFAINPTEDFQEEDKIEIILDILKNTVFARMQEMKSVCDNDSCKSFLSNGEIKLVVFSDIFTFEDFEMTLNFLKSLSDLSDKSLSDKFSPETMMAGFSFLTMLKHPVFDGAENINISYIKDFFETSVINSHLKLSKEKGCGIKILHVSEDADVYARKHGAVLVSPCTTEMTRSLFKEDTVEDVVAEIRTALSKEDFEEFSKLQFFQLKKSFFNSKKEIYFFKVRKKEDDFFNTEKVRKFFPDLISEIVINSEEEKEVTIVIPELMYKEYVFDYITSLTPLLEDLGILSEKNISIVICQRPKFKKCTVFLGVCDGEYDDDKYDDCDECDHDCDGCESCEYRDESEEPEESDDCGDCENCFFANICDHEEIAALKEKTVIAGLTDTGKTTVLNLNSLSDLVAKEKDLKERQESQKLAPGFPNTSFEGAALLQLLDKELCKAISCSPFSFMDHKVPVPSIIKSLIIEIFKRDFELGAAVPFESITGLYTFIPTVLNKKKEYVFFKNSNGLTFVIHKDGSIEKLTPRNNKNENVFIINIK